MHPTTHKPMQQASQPNPQPVSADATPPVLQPACANGPKPGQTKPPATPHRHSTATGNAHQPEPDLVDRIFEYILSDPAMARAVQAMATARDRADAQAPDHPAAQAPATPTAAADPLRHLKTAVRAEFQGERCYITARPVTQRQERVAQVLQLFNGRNATEVARRLQISRRSVYAYIKQARAGKP